MIGYSFGAEIDVKSPWIISGNVSNSFVFIQAILFSQDAVQRQFLLQVIFEFLD